MKKLIYNETTDTTFAPYDEENFNRVIGALIFGTTKKGPKKLVSADDKGYTFEGKIEDEELKEYLENSNNYKVKIFIFTEDYKHSRCRYEDREIRALDYFLWKMYDEIYEGMRYTNDEVAEMFNKCFDEPEANDLVCMTNIDTFSNCEHHLALMYNMKVSIAYIPKDNILGLSKFARIVDIISKRLQTQEKMGKDIMEVLETVLPQVPILVQIKAEHSCMTSRGIQKPGTQTVTLHTNDLVSEEIKKEFFNLLEEKK